LVTSKNNNRKKAFIIKQAKVLHRRMHGSILSNSNSPVVDVRPWYVSMNCLFCSQLFHLLHGCALSRPWCGLACGRPTLGRLPCSRRRHSLVMRLTFSLFTTIKLSLVVVFPLHYSTASSVLFSLTPSYLGTWFPQMRNSKIVLL